MVFKGNGNTGEGSDVVAGRHALVDATGRLQRARFVNEHEDVEFFVSCAYCRQ
jgi:hypothetical protein